MSFAHKNSRTIFIVLLLSLALFFLWAEAVAYAQGVETVAQEDAALAPAGLTSQSPFYAVDRFFERTGLFFAFGREARARRLMTLAEERLSEARVLADADDERAESLVDEYEETFEDATIEAELSDDESTEARLAEQAARHSAVLDRVVERVPEQAKERVRAARERFVENHISVIRAVAEKNPERAAEIFSKLTERRDRATERKAENKDTKDTDGEKASELRERFKESEKYAEFGEEISLIARKRGTGETKVDDILKRTAEHRIEVLLRVRENAPEAAQGGLDNALMRTREARAFNADGLSPAQVEERLLERKENAIERLEERRAERIDAINTRTDAQLEKRGEGDEAAGRLEERRVERINTVNTRTDTRIEGVNTRTENRINAVEKRAVETRPPAPLQKALPTTDSAR